MYLVIKTHKVEGSHAPRTVGRGRKPSVTATTSEAPKQEILAFPSFAALSTYILRHGMESHKVFDAKEINFTLHEKEVPETALTVSEPETETTAELEEDGVDK